MANAVCTPYPLCRLDVCAAYRYFFLMKYARNVYQLHATPLKAVPGFLPPTLPIIIHCSSSLPQTSTAWRKCRCSWTSDRIRMLNPRSFACCMLLFQAVYLWHWHSQPGTTCTIICCWQAWMYCRRRPKFSFVFDGLSPSAETLLDKLAKATIEVHEDLHGTHRNQQERAADESHTAQSTMEVRGGRRRRPPPIFKQASD